MIENIRVLLTENQLAQGFLFMWFITIGSIFLRSTPSKIYTYLKRKVVFSIEASDYDSGSRAVYYKLIRALMEECGDGNFSATKVTNHGFYDISESNLDVAKDMLTPNNSTRIIKLSGIRCVVELSDNASAQIKSDDWGRLFNNTLTVSTMLYNKNKLKEWMVSNSRRNKRDGINIHWHSNQVDGDHIRTMSYSAVTAMAVNKQTTDLIDKHLDVFMNNKDWYERVGKVRRLNILAHGAPGTGKTSLAYYLALKTKLPIRMISLSTFSIDTVHRLIMAMSENEAIYVFDDIDSVGGTANRDGASKGNKDSVFRGVSLDILLSMFDGPLQISNSICLLTTNHIEKLDPALYRDRRIDLNIEVINLTKVEVASYLARAFERPLDEVTDRILDNVSIAGSKMAGIYDDSPNCFETTVNKINKHLA